jgi:hypothetical protein
MQRVLLSLLILLVCLVWAGPVDAGTCSNPTGNEGDMIYNGAPSHTWQFCNGSTWIAMGAIGSTGGLMLISTQTASSSASLQFTNLPTSYNTLFLNCAGLLAGTAGGHMLVQIGEGAGPTWETTSHYVTAGCNGTSNGTGGCSGATNTDLTDGLLGPLTTTLAMSLKLYIDNVGSSSQYKNVTFTDDNPDSTHMDWQGGGAYWSSDTNPVTGLQVIPSTARSNETLRFDT